MPFLKPMIFIQLQTFFVILLGKLPKDGNKIETSLDNTYDFVVTNIYDENNVLQKINIVFRKFTLKDWHW